MTKVIDPRIDERRRTVREQGARRGLRRMVGLAVLLGAVGIGVWLAQSSMIDVDVIPVSGAVHSTPAETLASRGIRLDMPMLTAYLRAGRAEKALGADPWVRDAAVRIVLPDTVEVEVIEYRAAAWASTDDGWWLVSPEGVTLERHVSADAAYPRLDLRLAAVGPGQQLLDDGARGALAFASALDARFAAATTVSVRSGMVAAVVDGHDVLLGRPDKMEAKAAALEALLDQGVEPGSNINLVAPTRPAVTPRGS